MASAPTWLQFVMPPLLGAERRAVPARPHARLIVGCPARLPLRRLHRRAIPQWNLVRPRVIRHAILPCSSSSARSAAGHRHAGDDDLTQGEDYVVFAEAGPAAADDLPHYGIRNAMLPQATALALILGRWFGAVLEIIFAIGIGRCSSRASRAPILPRAGDVFIIIIAIGVATLILDLAYPLLDPRSSTRFMTINLMARNLPPAPRANRNGGGWRSSATCAATSPCSSGCFCFSG